MAKIPIALELYSVRHDLENDPLGTLKAVAEMGYEGVEFAGPPKHTGDELKAMLDETGLVCCGWHTPFNLAQDDTLDATIALNKTIGNPYVILPGIPEPMRRTREDWLKTAGFFNELAKKLAPHGMATGYHNHNIEFTELDGEIPWYTLFDNTDASVIMQLDAGNALSGGGDCIEILKRYPGRPVTVHLKPYTVALGKEDRRAGFRPIIGEDDIPWAEVFDLCEADGSTKWYIVEYESDAFEPLVAVRKCLEALRAMGK